MYELLIPDNCTSDCYDFLWYSLLKYYNYEYEALNISYWYTVYYEFVGNICYFKRKPTSIVQLLKDFYGINVFHKDIIANTDLHSVIAHEIKNAPVGIFIDPYYLEWTTFYKKTHYSHTLLIVDSNPKEKIYKCFDIYSNKSGYVKVDFDTIHNNCIKYFTYSISDSQLLTLDILKKKLYSLLRSNSTACGRLEQIVSAFKNNTPDKLFASDLHNSTTLINLMKISEDKRNFTFFFDLLKSKGEEYNFSQIKNKLFESERKFMIIKAILTKYAITGIYNKTAFEKTMLEIFEIDNSVKSALLNYCKSEKKQQYKITIKYTVEGD